MRPDEIGDSTGPTRDRRDFLHLALGAGVAGSLGSVAYPVVQFLRPPPVADASPDAVVAAKEGELPPNSGKIVRSGTKAALLVRKPDGTYAGFYAACTHLDCTVRYRSDLEMIHCACHDGLYDLQGRNVSGPPPRPLDPLAVKRRGDDVLLSHGA